MRTVYTGLLVTFLLVGLFSCDLAAIENRLFPCRTHVPQSHKFGNYWVDIKANKTTLAVGDTVFVNVKIDKQFYDSLSKQAVAVNDKVTLFLKLSNVSPPTNSGNAFAVDTTIYRVFDTYFTTRVLKGTRKDAYLFDCASENGFWLLSLQYIALKKGQYDLSASFREVKTGEPDLPGGVCMLGNSETFNAKVRMNTVNNQINRIYPVLPSLPYDLFGFVVD